MKKLLHTAALVSALATSLISGPALAQTAAVKVEGAWARASVQGQKGTGAFMRLTAKDGARLVRAESPAAGVTEVHEMKMEGDVMKMRAVPVLELPAGKTVELKPGGYHVMLLDLKAPLAKDSSVPITLVFQDAKGAESKLNLNVPVGTTPPGGATAGSMMDGHKH
ncbi:MAG: copper chaperone PCu(A)C [Acidovorax sp.]|uniref:copper chaperone PCu(A)C n=1 Tax=Acidovorax sp. TaxID=1872122 RepID=UPI00391B340A